MGLIIARVRDQRSLGTTAAQLTEDIKFDYVAHSLHVDVFALKNTGSAATIANLVQKITDIRLITQNGNPETTIQMDDLFDFWPLAGGIIPYHSINTSTDNIPHAFAVQFPLSPFPNDPTKNFGLPAEKGVQFVYNVAADGTQTFDTYVADLNVEGLEVKDKPAPLGYCKAVLDSYTGGGVGAIHDTTVTGNKLLGTMNFQTTSYDDLAASAANDVTGIRQQSVAYSENVAFSYRPAREWSMRYAQTVASFAAAAAVINILDDGVFWIDYGWNNQTSQLGLDISGKSVKVKTTGGVASEATRVTPFVLVQ